MEKENIDSLIENVNLTKAEEPKKITVTKDVVVSFPSDVSGCGHIRNIIPFTYLNSSSRQTGLNAIISNMFLTQQEILAKTRTIFFQRPLNGSFLPIIKDYKRNQPQFKYRMVWDLDDFVWGANENEGGTKEDGVPSYNFGSKNVTKELKESSIEIMKLMDTLTFSTQWLADYARNELGMTQDIVVVPNSVPQYLWGVERRPNIKTKLTKPRVLYTGSPSHYSNESKQYGDFEHSWADWIIDAVNKEEIEFVCLGGSPWFLESIKDKIKIYDFVNYYRYPSLVKSIRADIGIMPLTLNNFNRAKSDLKAIEFYAAGVPSIGSVFPDGTSPYEKNPVTLPYNATVKDIRAKVEWLCYPENHNKVKDQQYSIIKDEGRYLESRRFVDSFMAPLIPGYQN